MGGESPSGIKNRALCFFYYTCVCVCVNMRPIQSSSMYTHSYRICANPPKIAKQQGEIPNRKSTKKKKRLAQLIKSKMRGLMFVNLVSEQAARQKRINESMHASHTALSPPSLTSHLFRAINFAIHIHNNTHRARKRW